ncbi:MAG TPA: MarR family transcriptional regulator [Gaiellaceae bacterium]|jgi:DNA-binding MarR family transcriptional regulator
MVRFHAGRITDAELGRVAAFRSELRGFLRRTELATAAVLLTPQRYDLLLMIRSSGGNEGVRVTELCSMMHMQQPTVTELVKRAEEAKLVTRRPSRDDRRASLLRLTAKGERRLQQATAALHDDRERLASVLAELDSRQPTA